MSRIYNVSGEVMVYVFGGVFTTLTELGLCSDSIRIVPRYAHRDIPVDDFGPDIPAEVLTMTLEAYVRMTLVHFDPIVLGFCIAQAAGTTVAGTCGAAGIPLLTRGLGISLNLRPLNDIPWRFRNSYIDGNPIENPIGTQHSLTQINWRCLPVAPSGFSIGHGYTQEPRSAGAVVWDRGVLDE